MTQHRDEHLDLTAGYVLGSLDAADRERLERHLEEGCDVCEAAIADFSAATVLLAASAPAMPAPRALRARVVEAVSAAPRAADEGRSSARGAEAERREARGKVIELRPRARSGGAPEWIPWLVAAALLVTSGLFGSDARRLRGELDARRRDVVDLNARLAEEVQLNQVLSAPAAKVAVLELTPQGEQALRARATFDPDSRHAVIVFDHFQAPSGHDYQLWALHGATPASLGVIKTDARGRAVLHLENAGDPATLAAFAVSLEPAGGSPNPAAPSGPVVMLGKLGG